MYRTSMKKERLKGRKEASVEKIQKGKKKNRKA